MVQEFLHNLCVHTQGLNETRECVSNSVPTDVLGNTDTSCGRLDGAKFDVGSSRDPAFPAEGRPDLAYAATAWVCLTNASRSALIWSALVVGIPCGNPGYTLSVAPFTSFADWRAAAAIGTI
jgi:hypothetical protein